MPELPEVEVVRRGLDAHVVGRVIRSVSVLHPRATRRHELGSTDLENRLTGRRVVAAQRRGKYLWMITRTEAPGASGTAGSDDLAVVVHLGMSGQMLVQQASVQDEKHLRIRVELDGGSGPESDAAGGRELRFVDQRTFGGWALAEMVSVDGTEVPTPVAHIARDPLDPLFDARAAVCTLRAKHTEIKRALLDQTVVSGIGNIYADEALWRSKIHGGRLTDSLTRQRLHAVIDAATDVMEQALEQGGTSFDALYVNVNGQSGYFDRSLAAYGQEDRPCPRCGAPIRREKFMNRSSFSCPRCQPRPRIHTS